MTDDLDPRPAGEAGLPPLPAADDAAPAADEAGLPSLPAADDRAAPAADDPLGLPAGDASLLALVDRLAGLLERSDLLELEVEAGGTAITLRKPAALAGVAGLAVPSAAVVPAEGAVPRAGSHAPAANPGAAPAAVGAAATTARAAVLAPLTGIFYASPTPGSPPFVEAGREVVVGQVIGLIEAMKLFNEIKSDKAGRVVRVLPENGMLVKAKQPLIEVEPL
jgi:acetyl-CoA carboxylase biotin carboxyl carrier protein